jgi:hypothetical protein
MHAALYFERSFKIEDKFLACQFERSYIFVVGAFMCKTRWDGNRRLHIALDPHHKRK